MIVEVTGCSGAGKSTLVREIVRHCRERGVPLRTGVELALGAAPAHPTLQNVALDVVGCRRRRQYRAFLDFAWRVIRRDSDGLLTALNAYRGVLRTLGLHAILARPGNGQTPIVVDEGPVNLAHNVLAHVVRPPRAEDVATFVTLAPRADLIVVVTAPLEIVLRRTLARPDPPLRHRSRADNARYICHAHALFERLIAHPALSERTLRISNDDNGWHDGNGGVRDLLARLV